MPTISFTVLGLPVPQGSARAITHRQTGRAVLIQSNREALAVWRASVAHAAQRAMRGRPPVAEGPVALRGIFTLPVRKSRPQVLRTPRQRLQWGLPWRKPDLSKLVRACEDALIGVLYADDAQIVRLDIRKQYGQTPGLMLRVEWSDDVAAH
jgi:crossover junction endodeoxyribonuclease RusA